MRGRAREGEGKVGARVRQGADDVLIHQEGRGMLDMTTAVAMVGVDACHAMAPVSCLYRGTEEGGKGRGRLGHGHCGHMRPKDTVGF